jgi:Alpha-kinase family
MTTSAATRTNLNPSEIIIDETKSLGEGTFRRTYEGIYKGGQRNGQKAACKRFHYEYRYMEDEFFQSDFKVIDKAIELAAEWNSFCRSFEKIRFNRGNVLELEGNRGEKKKFLVEPLVQPFYKYTSNNGYIRNRSETGLSLLMLEAFCHYTYHVTGGALIVCDLQGQYKRNHFVFFKSRYNLTDPAICSRIREYGPTDLGEKGIESFFAHHVCNQFCRRYGKGRWDRPQKPKEWIRPNRGTSMLRSSESHLVFLTNNLRLNAAMTPIIESEDED